MVMSAPLQRYVASVIVAGCAAIAVSLAQLPGSPRTLEWVLFVVAGVLAGAYSVKIPGLDARISVSDTFFLALAILFGPAPATVATVIDCAILSWRRRYRWERLLFNITGPPLSLWIAANLFFFVCGMQPVVSADVPVAKMIVPLLGTAFGWFLLNSVLTAIAVALEAGTNPLHVWQRMSMLGVNYGAAASAAFCLVIVTRYAGLTAAAAVLPLVFIFHLTIRSWLGRLDDAQQHIQKVDRLYLSTIETLATAIEAKDGVTHDHIRRVQIYATGLARELGVRDKLTIQAIEAAALLHDTGKLAVPEHILNKPGKLTPEEFDQMKLHVDVGADILSAIDFPYPVVPIVRCHHENWDGTGYPRGVSGADIPIGARILSVVDCFDALTSDRPYRRALSDDAAIAILRERRGTMYDPLVVDTFIRVLPDIAQRVLPPMPHDQALAQISRSAVPPQAVVPPAPVADVRVEAPDDLVSLASLARIVTADSAFDDVASLAGIHVRRIIPRGTCVVFLARGNGEDLVVCHAAGPLAPNLAGMSIRLGHNLTGWVAAHRRTIVNSDAALDLADVLPPTGPPHTCMSTPLVDGSSLVGVLTFYAEAAEPFGEDHNRLAQLIAPHLARMFAVCRPSALECRPCGAAA